MTVVRLSEDAASSRACPPSPSAAFHGGFLTGGLDDKDLVELG